MSSPETTDTRAYEGKAKHLHVHSDGTVAMAFKDDATAFNGQKHARFPGKGALNSQISERLFTHLIKQGFATHHLGRIDAHSLRVRAVEIIPLEVVVRFRVAGSLAKRTGLPAGTSCAPPVVELYYKRDDLGDPLLNDAHVQLLGIATASELSTLRARGIGVARELHALFARADIELIDLKLEFGRSDAELLLADEISGDTCRLHDRHTGTVLDKDRFRKDLGDLLVGYREIDARLARVLGESP